MSEALKTLLLASIAAAVLTFVSPGTAQAQRKSTITGEILNTLCTSSDDKSTQSCKAYIDGVLDSALTYQQLRPATGARGAALPDYLCVPGSLGGQQLLQAYVEAYKRSPDPNRLAAVSVLSAFSKAYPCSTAPRRTP